MLRYPTLIDGEKGAYGVTFPDLPGIVAMGETEGEAVFNAGEALHDYAVEAEADGEEIISPSSLDKVAVLAGQRLVSIPLVFQDKQEARTTQSALGKKSL